MDVAGLCAQLQKYDQEHLLAFWEDLSEEQRTLLYNELSQLDLEYVTQSFDRCVADLNAKAEKLDDRMEPLPSEFRTMATLASLFFCSQVIEKSSGSNCF